MRVKTVANVRVGKAQTTHDRPSHVKGVREGNATGHLKREKGFRVKGQEARGTAARSTGINPRAHNPIHPAMPNLSPP